jgi:RHS repeat-associated protein
MMQRGAPKPLLLEPTRQHSDYDYDSRVTQITYPNSSTNTFQYNGLSARSQKVDSAGTANYLRDGVAVTSPVLNDSSATYTPGISERRSGATTFEKAGIKNWGVQHDGSQAVLATKSYDVFGNQVANTGTWNGPFGYGAAVGYQSDANSGLMLLGYRYYDSSTGRFITRDPVKAGRNWYTYCENNPARHSDSSGLDLEGDIRRLYGEEGLRRYRLLDKDTQRQIHDDIKDVDGKPNSSQPKGNQTLQDNPDATDEGLRDVLDPVLNPAPEPSESRRVNWAGLAFGVGALILAGGIAYVSLGAGAPVVAKLAVIGTGAIIVAVGTGGGGGVGGGGRRSQT